MLALRDMKSGLDSSTELAGRPMGGRNFLHYLLPIAGSGAGGLRDVVDGVSKMKMCQADELIQKFQASNRRDFLKILACGLTAAACRHGPAQADDNVMWKEILSNIEAFRSGARKRGLSGSWDRQGVPIKIDIRPPAGEAAVAAVEAEIGQPIPPRLRQFYRDVSAGMEIEWLVPGKRVTLSSGASDVRYDILPPPPFQSATMKDGQPEPVINAGHIRFFLDDIADNLQTMAMWTDSFRKAEALYHDEPLSTLHYKRYAQWWDRGFPLGEDMGGNMVAIDRQDSQERLLWLCHDGADEPGWFIEHDLMEFLRIQSRLGWTGFRGLEFFFFRDRNAKAGDREQDYLHRHAGDGADAPLPPWSYRLDDDSEEAKIWREWLNLLAEPD